MSICFSHHHQQNIRLDKVKYSLNSHSNFYKKSKNSILALLKSVILRTFIFLFLFAFQFVSCQNVEFEETLQTAFEKAKKENKLVFIEYYNSDCTICKSIEPLFSNSELAKFYNSNFINYKLNTNGGLQGADLDFMTETGLKFQGVPFFLFFDANKKFVHYSGAKADVDYLLGIGKTALNPTARTGSLQEKYESGDRTIRTLYAYADLVQLYQNDKLQNEISTALYAVYPKENLGTHQSYLILKNAVFSITNGFYVYWYENRAKLKGFEKGAKAGTESEQLERILLHSLRGDEKKTWSLEQISKAKEMILTSGLSNNPNDFLWETEATALYREGNTKEAVHLFEELLTAEKANMYASLYITDFFMKLFMNKKELDLVKLELDTFSKSVEEVALQADIFYQEIVYYTKINDSKKASDLKTKALEFYKKHNLDATQLNEM